MLIALVFVLMFVSIIFIFSSAYAIDYMHDYIIKGYVEKRLPFSVTGKIFVIVSVFAAVLSKNPNFSYVVLAVAYSLISQIIGCIIIDGNRTVDALKIALIAETMTTITIMMVSFVVSIIVMFIML